MKMEPLTKEAPVRVGSASETRNTISALLYSEQPLVRAGLRYILEDDPSIRVKFQVDSKDQVIRVFRRVHPDIVILHISMPVIDGLDVVRRLKTNGFNANILVISSSPNHSYTVHFLKGGALGFITLASQSQDLRNAVHKVASGRRFLSKDCEDAVLSKLLDSDADDDPVRILSDRELQVICLIAGGYKLGEIAIRLNLSVRTIETYRSRLMNKFHFSRNSHIVSFALENGLIQTCALT